MREGSGDGIESVNGDHNHDEAGEIESNNPEIAVINKKPAMQVIKENSFLEFNIFIVVLQNYVGYKASMHYNMA